MIVNFVVLFILEQTVFIVKHFFMILFFDALSLHFPASHPVLTFMGKSFRIWSDGLSIKRIISP